MKTRLHFLLNLYTLHHGVSSDGFFIPVCYRGGFSSDDNWLAGWTAADEYGFIDGVSSQCGSCSGDANADGVVGFQDLTTVLGNWGCTGN